jgi:hypothetical protein
MVRKDYSPRQKLRHWVFIVACISLLVGQASLETQAAEQKHSRIHLFGEKLSDEEFYKLLNKTLGNNYESLQVAIAACNSGGFADKDFVKPHLQGTWSVTAARDVERGMSVEVEDNGGQHYGRADCARASQHVRRRPQLRPGGRPRRRWLRYRPGSESHGYSC